MLTQTSKAALKSKQRAEFVVTSTRTENARVSAQLNQLYSATLREGQEPHAWDALQESNARLLELSIAEVLEADDQHRRNLVEASQLRHQRRKLIASLARQIRDLRLSFTGHHGADALELVGLEAPPATTLASLTKQAQDVLLRLRDPVIELPPANSGVGALDPTPIADAMEADVEALGGVMAALVEARKRTDRSLVAKRQALARHRQRYLNVARIQEAYYRHQAMGCCRFCRSDWLRRMGDWQVENRDGELALALVEDARRELGDQLDADTRGRLRFVRGIAYHFLGRRDLAIADAGAALGELSLASPRGYFLDTMALPACFLAGASQVEDATALGHLLRFKRRLKNVDGFSDVRCRLAWVGGQLHARLGDLRRGRDRLESALAVLSNDGPPRHAVAVTADLVQIHARRAHESNLRPARRLIERCRTLEGLDAALRRRLAEVETVLRRRPEDAFEVVAQLRHSFIVPVAGLLAQRPPETWHPSVE